MINAEVQRLFDELVQLLEKNGEHFLANAALLASAENRLDSFLISNELWGGPGSIADQGGVSAQRTSGRREIERVLIELGNEQIKMGKVNPRTAGWVQAFTEWQRSGM